MKIHVVDDEKYIRKLLVRSLEREGNSVIPFESGDLYLDAYDPDNAPDILILDIMMPGKDGIEVFREISKTHNVPAVIFVSAFDYTGELKHVVNDESVWFLAKPFGLYELRRSVDLTTAYIERTKRCQSSEHFHVESGAPLNNMEKETSSP
jgi:DNA-binding response OmpR family regulator